MPKYIELDLSNGSKHDVTIDETRDFKGAGGEKKIFVKGQKAYGIYHDPQNAMPMEKCDELRQMSHPRIIKPIGLLFKASQRVGETMLAVQDPWVLCSLFTMAFRKQHNLKDSDLSVIVKAMNEIVAHAHSHSIYVVDNNENNWLLSNDFRNVYAIDTGNWQTKSFPSQMIMLNIKDPFNPPGSKADWYAQAILLANLYIAKHPFEASHPQYDNLPKASVVNGVNQRPRMQQMMKDRVSFFDPLCKLNRACYPLDSIPSALRLWIKETLSGDLRTEPPNDFETIAAVRHITAISISRKFSIVKLFTTVGDIFRVVKPSLTRTILTSHCWYVDQLQNAYPSVPNVQEIHVAYTAGDQPVLCWIADGRLKLYHSTGPIECDISARGIVWVDGRLVVINHSQAIEIDLVDSAGSFFVRMKTIGQLLDMPQATQILPGCVVQNVLGSWRVSVFPIKGRCVSSRLYELEGSSVVDAKYESGVLMVIGQKSGIYSRYLYFETDFKDLNLVRTDANIMYEGMNWTVNGQRTMTMIVDDGQLEAMRVNTQTQVAASTVIADSAITTDMILSAEGNKTHFYRGNELYSLTVK